MKSTITRIVVSATRGPQHHHGGLQRATRGARTSSCSWAMTTAGRRPATTAIRTSRRPCSMRSPPPDCGSIVSTPRIRIARPRAPAFSPDAIRTAWAPSRPAGRSGRRRSPSRTSSARPATAAVISANGMSAPVKAGSPTNPGAMGFHEWVSHDNFFELNPSLSRNGGPPEVFKGESSEIVVREAIRFIDRARQDRQTLLHRRLVRLAARALQRPARRSRALRRPAREIPGQEGQASPRTKPAARSRDRRAKSCASATPKSPPWTAPSACCGNISPRKACARTRCSSTAATTAPPPTAALGLAASRREGPGL